MPQTTRARTRGPREGAVVRDPEIHSGDPVFRGTRVPVGILFDYLEDGQSIDDFLHHYPSVSREQAVAALEEAEQSLGAGA